MTLSREDTRAAYDRHRKLHEAGHWGAIADLFAEDGRYSEPYFGELVGREAIRAFLVKSMAGLEAWTFPIEWTVVDEGRVVSHWQNRLPGTRRGGGHFEFPGISTITYDDHGMIARQVDFYDRMKVLQVVAEARSRVVEHAVAGIGRIGRSVVMGTHWLVAKTSAGVR
ncbi:nuclear transport factor 2 family protein [Paraliomyxa miuraensis]|uniref:nuclear transport factor 2 family protein n=1 Tax=Paraliomyxa miuraensis TaxID=376150 RepID=UPI00224D75AB|nr:nuclear transport factor 2 family protein [Paraliomyxa miuraensis]MCX4240942.1 nuclear transport factor 2 family protein [Paraliomyxa miuraensis]